MSLKRILKLLAAFFAGQGVSVVTQLLVPPFFLHRYADGVEVYGEWIALSAAVSYLNTLNYGIQNYTNNQVSIHYNRGEVERAKAVQASSFRLLLTALVVLSSLSATVLLMPLQQWLGLRHVSSHAASLTVFFLILQVIIGWCFALIANSYMVVGEAHRGQHWANAQRLTAMVAMSIFLWNRASFPVLALVQLVTVILFSFLVIADVRFRAPFLLPTMKCGSWAQARAMIKPSAWFMMLAISGFLSWQGPVLLIQKLLGPAAVAVFGLTRIVFNMSRQILMTATFAIAQDISRLVGQRNWVQLRRLYELSEKVILLLVPTTTVGVILMCPFLFTVWLHKRSLYDPGICLMMGAISAVMGIKEHKYQFQWSSNEHTNLSKFTFAAYSSMILIAALFLKTFGVESFLTVWLVTEVIQVVYILHLNVRLFPPEAGISVAPVLRLGLVLMISLSAAVWPTWRAVRWPLPLVVTIAILASLAVAFVSYHLFDLSEVRSVIERRFRQRLRTVG